MYLDSGFILNINPGGSLTTNGVVYIGLSSGGEMNLLNGGTFTGTDVNVGVDVFAFGLPMNGFLNVDGAGSYMQLSGMLDIASQGALVESYVSVLNGGVLEADSVQVGVTGGYGNLLVSNAGSAVTLTGGLMTVGTGGGPASYGTVQVTDGAVINGTGYIYNGTLDVNSGGQWNGDLLIGGYVAATGTAVIEGAGTSIAGSFFVSENGVATVQDGAALGSGLASYITVNNAGQLTLTDSDTVLDADTVSISGAGSALNMTGGATGMVSGASSTPFVPMLFIDEGALNVSGAGTEIVFGSLAGSGNIIVRNGGITISGGGRMVVDRGAFNVADLFGTAASVAVDGADSELVINSITGLTLGSGDGALDVVNGGYLYTVGSITAGGNAVNILVDDVGSLMEVDAGASLMVGSNSGAASMTVSNGAGVIAPGYMGVSAMVGAGNSSLYLMNAGTTMTAGLLTVGRGAGNSATLSIQNGAVMTARRISVGSDGAVANVYIDGAGSMLNLSGLVTGCEGIDCLGTVEVSNGGVINVGAGALDPAAQAGGLYALSVTGGVGGGAVNFNHTANNYTVDAILDGVLDVNVYAGTTILTAANVYAGATSVMGGRLIVDGSITSPTTVDAGAILGGTGTVDNVINNGIIEPGALTTPGALTIAGSYFGGAGSELRLNTALGVDASPTDLLIFDGSVATGATQITITNVGGMGGYSTADGIRIIQSINGATTQAGMFTLAAPVQVGIYDYQLLQGGSDPSTANDWFLHAASLSANVPVYAATPELVSGYVRDTLGTVHDRMDIGDEMAVYRQAQMAKFTGGSIADVAAMEGAWARAFGGQRKFRSGDAANSGYDADFGGIQAGKDLIRRDHNNGARDRAGLYLVQGRVRADMTSTAGNAGKASFDATSVGAYWTRIGKRGGYLGASAQYSRIHEFEVTPAAGAGVSPGAYDYSGSVEVGKQFKTGRLMLEPQAQLIYQRLKIADANDGVNQIRFDAQQSVTARGGLRLSRAHETESGLATQYWSRANILQTFASDATLRMGADTFRTPMDGTQGEVELGFSVGRATKDGAGWSLYANGGYLASIAGAKTSGWTATTGLRLNW